MPLLEVIVTHAAPRRRSTATGVEVGKKQGKTVIVVNDGAGFYTSRILAPVHERGGVAPDRGRGDRRASTAR